MTATYTYLVECFHTHEEHRFADITRFLANALLYAQQHLVNCIGPFLVDSQFSAEGAFAGVSVFDAEGERVCAITAYQLAHDDLEPDAPRLQVNCLPVQLDKLLGGSETI